jgi:tetratricopeptide (TPR) repeat protein
VLPHLGAKTAAEVLDELLQGGAEADNAAGSDPMLARTQSLMACIEYGHGHLDPDEQALLLCFAPFIGVIDTEIVKKYEAALAAELPPGVLPLNRLEEVLERARNLGLLQRDAKVDTLLRPQPVLSWFLTRRLAVVEESERRESIERAFRSLYDFYADFLFRLQNSNNIEDRQIAQVLVEYEYANLGTALRLALNQQSSIVHVYRILSTHLERRQDNRRGLELGELVLEKLKYVQCNAVTAERGFEIAGVLIDIANRQRSLQQFDRARVTFENALAINDSIGLELQQVRAGRAKILHYLGSVADEQRRFADAEAAYKEALEIYVSLDLHHDAAFTYHNLGVVVEAQGRFADAESHYKKALETKLAFGDRLSTASTYHQLGIAKQNQGRFAEAQVAYQKALEIWLDFKDSQRAARCYHQLGEVAYKQGSLEEAKVAYKSALKILVAFDDRHGAALTYHCLGTLVADEGRLDEAHTLYQKALEIFLAFDDSHHAAKTYDMLGHIAAKQDRLKEAESAWKSALEIFLAEDNHGAAFTYHNLGLLAVEECSFDKAEMFLQNALEMYLSSDERENAADCYRKLGMVAEKQGRMEEAEAAYKGALEIYATLDRHHRAAETYYAVGHLAEEQRRWADAEAAYLNALETCVRFDDHRSADVVLRSFARLWMGTNSLGIPATIATILGKDVGEVTKLLKDLAAAAQDPVSHGP